jgi:hypothetical protein
VLGTGTEIRKGAVRLWLGVLDPETIAEVERRFAGERVCIEGIDPKTVPVPGPQPLTGDGWRLLGDEQGGGVYRTGIAADRQSFRRLWSQAGMTGDPPRVDFEHEVALWFAAVYGSTCPDLRLDDVVVDPGVALVHPLIVNLDTGLGCTDDANGHAYLVAVDRDRLPAPPFRIQLQAQDPPLGATREITLVEADLREPGSVPGRGEVRTVRPPQDQRFLRSGDIMETGFPDEYLLDARCGVEWLGRLNDVWWRTDVPDGETAWMPDRWRRSLRSDGMLEVSVLLREGADPVVRDGQPRAEVSRDGRTVVYHATADTPPACG